jgi:two-component system sensor histidine kinase KdpD
MESERLRNSLLAAMSHDLRTPLTSLVGWPRRWPVPAALSPAQLTWRARCSPKPCA